MRRLFFKTVFGISGIIVLGILSLVFFVIEPAFDEFGEIEYQEETSLEHRLVYVLLADQPFEEWQTSIAGYSSFFELTTSLVKHSDVPADAERFTTPDGQSGEFWVDEEDLYYSYYPSPDPEWLILYEEGDSELVDESRAEMAVALLFIGPLVIIILAMLLGIGYLLYAFSRPMQALEAAIEGFSHDTKVRLGQEHGKLIPNIVTAFNGMADRLGSTLTEQQVMIAAIPHELRTPIARIRFALDMLRGKQGETLWQGLERIDNYVDELQQTSENILELSKVNQEALILQPISLTELVTQSCGEYREASELAVSMPDDNVLVQGNSGLIQRVLGNLLDNALQYHQSYIALSLTMVKEHAVICIENDGADLSAEDISQLFQPFYRADSSRSRRSGGLGIGLTLVAQIITRHKGEVSAELIRPDVIQVKVSLPVIE